MNQRKRPPNRLQSTANDRVVVVGAGIAALFAALKLAPVPVLILAPRLPGDRAASEWIQAGFAAASGPGDSPERHADDTIRVGGGIVSEGIARIMAAEAPDRVEDLARLGVCFDRDAEERLTLRTDPAHSRPRIISAHGDDTGRRIHSVLAAAVRKAEHILVLDGYEAEEIALSDGHAAGVIVRQASGLSNVRELVPASAVVLATGGLGHLYTLTTNAADARGEGVAMAVRAGALAADMEFVQFHPTAIAVGRDPAPVATEALLGEGGLLVDGSGGLLAEHSDADSARNARDVLARAVHRARASGGGAFLDCRGELGARIAEAFPAVAAICRAAGIDPSTDPVPVAPAAHYHMGGILVDADGRSTLDGLWACGEAASTGAHGANRLAANSLVEAVVFAARIATNIKTVRLNQFALKTTRLARAPMARSGRLSNAEVVELRRVMNAAAGVERNAADLCAALDRLDSLGSRLAAHGLEANMLITSRLVLSAALDRRETRGAHFRTDHPDPDPAFASRSFHGIGDIQAVAHHEQRGAA